MSAQTRSAPLINYRKSLRVLSPTPKISSTPIKAADGDVFWININQAIEIRRIPDSGHRIEFAGDKVIEVTTKAGANAFTQAIRESLMILLPSKPFPESV